MEVIAAWLREHTAFVADPEGPSDSIELLRDPVLQLRRIAQTYTAEGDCDDAAMLAAALGCAAGFPVRFRVVGFTPDPRGPVVHVFTELYHAPAWRPLDVTRPVDPTERFPVPVTRTWVYYV